MSSASDFGRDYGLIHEAVVTSRKVGWGHDVWSKLAHDEERMWQVGEFLSGRASIVDNSVSMKKICKELVAVGVISNWGIEAMANRLSELLYPPKRHVIDCDADPFIPPRWSVVEHRKGGKFIWTPEKVRLHRSEYQKNGKVVKGNKLRKELANKPVLNANVLDYLLAHPHLIPEEWKGQFVFFWGTIYRDSGGDLVVRCLSWDEDSWHWSFYWLGLGLDDDFPAVVRVEA